MSQHVKDLTHGNITRELIELALPMVAGNILQEFYNTIDAFVVGRYAGEAQFAAIGVAGTVMNLFLYILVGSCGGFSILFARAYGTQNMRELCKEICSALCVGFSIALTLMIAGSIGGPTLLRLLQTPDELVSYVLVYLKWILLALPAAFLYNLFAALLRASGDTSAALAVLAGAIVSNLILDLVLVARCSMGIEGAAIATAFTQLLSALACGIYLYHSHAELHFQRPDLRIDSRHIVRTAQFGLVTACQQCALYLGKMLVQGSVNALGTEVIAAYTAAGRIEGFANSFGSSGSTATSIVVSQNYGSGNRARVAETYRRSLRILFITGIVSISLMVLLAPAVSRFLLGTTASISTSETVRYLRWISAFYIFCFIGNTFTGYYSGIGRLMIGTSGTMGHITLRVILCLFLVPQMGLAGVALATGIGWVLANVYWYVVKAILVHRG